MKRYRRLNKTKELSYEESKDARTQLIKRGIVCAWLLDKHQLEIYEHLLTTNASDILLLIARRWGKSVLSCAFAFEYCLNNPNSIVRIAGPTKGQAHEIASDIIDPLIMPYASRIVKKARTSLVWRFRNGSSLRLGTIQRAHVDTLRGGGDADIVIIEEGAAAASSDDYKYAYRSVIMPQLIRKKGKVFHITTPSDEPDHFVHSEIIPKCEESGTLFVRDITTNTALSQKQIDDAIANCGGMNSDDCQRELFCKIIKSAITALFPTDIEPVPFELPAYYNALIAIDTGGVRDKTVGLVMAYDFKNNKTLIVDEVSFEPNTASNLIIDGLKRLEKPYFDNIKARWADGSGQLLIDFRQVYEYPAMLPLKQDWLANLNQLRTELERGNVLVHPRCDLLNRTIRNGRLNRQRSDFERSVTLGHCDAVAAAMYGFRMMNALKLDNPWPDSHDPSKTWKGMQKQDDDTLLQLAKALAKHDRRKR